MDIQNILNYLPQRYPFLLVDKVIFLVPRKSITAIKNVTINEPFFLGHFPGLPIMPGVLILEAMAQATGILALYTTSQERDKEKLLYLFAGVDKARFKRSVVPGDQIQIEAKVQWIKRGIWKCYVESTVSGQLVCSAELMGVGRRHNQ